MVKSGIYVAHNYDNSTCPDIAMVHNYYYIFTLTGFGVHLVQFPTIPFFVRNILCVFIYVFYMYRYLIIHKSLRGMPIDVNSFN